MGIKGVIAIVMGILVALGSQSIADSPSQKDPDLQNANKPPRKQLYAGAFIARQSTFYYTGSDTAIMSDLHRSGFRMRFVGGAGDSIASPGGINAWVTSLRFVGGYQHIGDGFGVALYAGWLSETRTPERPEPFNPKTGQHSGVVIEADAYWHLNERWMLSGWGMISEANDIRSIQFRAMRKFRPRLSIGGEAAYYRDVTSHEERFGAVTDLMLVKGLNLELSGGFVSDGREDGSYGNAKLTAAGLQLPRLLRRKNPGRE